MLKTLKQKIWWFAIIVAGVSQHGAWGPGATVLIVATFLKAIAYVWRSLPQLWRDRHRHQLPSSNTLYDRSIMPISL